MERRLPITFEFSVLALLSFVDPQALPWPVRTIQTNERNMFGDA
jgi:hypothetical protein